MDEANEGKRNLSGMEKLSLQTNRNPKDLLQRFMASNPSQLGGETSPGNEEEEEEEDIELNLGLSMGGRFGVDKTAAKKKLMRSSSIAGAIPIVRDRGGDNEVAPPPASNPTLIRTSSLPAETEEEWRKRKELQTLRRMAAKRRRSEKQRNFKGEKDSGGRGSLGEERRCGLPTWAASASRQALIAGSKGNYGGGGGGGGVGGLQPSGSMESVGGSSSVMSESESRPFQVSSSCSEASPKSIQSLQEAVGSSGAKEKGKNASKSAGGEMAEEEEEEEVVEKQLGRRETGLNSLEDMPGVFTQGDGPNGRRIEGILYKYGKGEEVKIMCICHGSFLSPAEFVKHAGGTDVAHPLKHIVVNPSSSSFIV